MMEKTREKIGLLLDSTTFTRTDFANKLYLKIVALNVTYDGIDFPETALSNEQAIAKLHAAKKMTTSQPAPGLVLEKYQEFFKEGYTKVLVITLSAPISGTYQSAIIAKDLVDFPLEVEVRAPLVCSYGVALGIPLICEKIEQGASFKEVVARYEQLYADAQVMFTLPDLMHLFRGGRLGIVSALLGTVLRVKPIIEMVEGKLTLAKRERTNQGCIDFFMEKIRVFHEKHPHVWIDVVELNRLEWADKLAETIHAKYPNTPIHRTGYVSPVFLIHLGDHGFGIALVGD